MSKMDRRVCYRIRCRTVGQGARGEMLPNRVELLKLGHWMWLGYEWRSLWCFFFFQAEDGIRDYKVTGVQTCALPIWFVLGGKLLNFVVVDALVFLFHSVGHEFVHPAGEIQRMPVCQVAAVREIHSEKDRKSVV